MAVAKYFLDTSAESRIRHDQVGERIDNLLQRGLVATCGMLNMEAAWSAQSQADLEQLISYRMTAFEYVDTEEEDWERAQQLQLDLCRAGLHRSAKHPDVIISAVAERHGLVVLHYDLDFEHIASVSELRQEWIVPRGTLDSEPTAMPEDAPS